MEHSKVAPENLIAVFTYGTLRPHPISRHSSWAGAAEVAPPSRGWVVGRIYMGPGFPYAVYDPDDGWHVVVGDVLMMDRTHPDFEHMCNVERGAGYFEQRVPVRLIGGASVEAVMFVATERSLARYGQEHNRIVSGDWHRRDTSMFMRR